ncbi:MAG TPA: hypothetical protein VFW68_04210 [Rhodocyclaceae bacterium]|nr:hypothetical protein [Rhodocyclaceae bacterium]
MPPLIPDISSDLDDSWIIERPDGFYWRDKHEDREYGPFPSLVDAMNDMQAPDDEALETGETVEEAEQELGISDWIDPETGAPGEDGVPHLEDH